MDKNKSVFEMLNTGEMPVVKIQIRPETLIGLGFVAFVTGVLIQITMRVLNGQK